MIKGWVEDNITYNLNMTAKWDRVKTILNGHACMCIIQIKKVGDTPDTFSGHIQLKSVFEVGHPDIHRTEIYEDFKECAEDIEGWWEDLIGKEFGLIEYGE